jgi:O-antigen/teichoic acid export membrane protein
MLSDYLSATSVELFAPLFSVHNLFWNGMLQALNKRYIPVEMAGSSIAVGSVTVGQLTPILVILAAGVIIATVLMVTENVYHNFHRKRRKNILKFY